MFLKVGLLPEFKFRLIICLILIASQAWNQNWVKTLWILRVFRLVKD